MAAYDAEDIEVLSPARVRCTLCNVFFANNESVIDTHVDGYRHGDLFYNRLKIRNNIVFDEDLYCSICQVVIPSVKTNNLSVVRDHVEGEQHQSNMEEIEDLIDGDFVDLPENVTSQGTLVHCTICHCYIGFTYHSISEHINGRRHLLNRSIAVQPLNGIFPVTDTDDELWCKICDVYIDNAVDDILDHVNSNEEHETGLVEIEDTIDDEDISIEEFLNTVYQDKAYCNKCSVWVPCNPHNLQEHIDGERHSR